MKLLLVLLAIHFDFIITSYLHYPYDDQESSKKLHNSLDEIEFEPIINLNKDKEKVVIEPGIYCEDFTKYAMNCTVESAMLYNSSKKAPPMPAKMADWCKAIRYLTNCAIDWNSECKDVTERHFNEESIKGHMHVVNNICDDEWFLSNYDESPTCIDRAEKAWESCYDTFKTAVDKEKNRSQEWTHYEIHFLLCCARTKFRRCTLNALFMQEESKCAHDQAVVLQKFSVIVSEGDVFQDCEHNVMYSNCPGGDPRPPSEVLAKFVNEHGTTATAIQMLRDDARFLTGPRYVLGVLIGLLKLCM